jgi:hypothetical protein
MKAGENGMKLFTKPGCEKCDWVKERMPEEAQKSVDFFDIMTADGLAELAYYELVGVAEKQLPILLTGDGEIVTGAIRINREIEGRC